MDNKKTKRLILLLLLIALFAIVLAIWALFFRDNVEVIVPDRVPSIEDNAEKIPGDDSQKSDTPADGGSVSPTFKNEVIVDLKNNIADLYFANPNKSTHDTVLQIVVGDTVIAQSGAIVSGNQISELSLADNANKMLVKGEYNGKFVLHFYDKTTGIIDTTANLEIEVIIKVI